MIFEAPDKIIKGKYKSIFLAGTIEMGISEDWQSNIIKELEDYKVDIYNPRRKEWNSDWKQEINNPKFNEQVNWELNGLNMCNIIVMNFLKDSKSPISLLELGLYASSGKLLVCCPDGFYRKGNVEIVCSHYDIPLFNTINDLMKKIKEKIK